MISQQRLSRRPPLRFLSLLLSFLCFGLARAPAQTTAQTDAAKFEQLDRVVREELKETKTPGAAVAVISEGRVVYSKGFGVTSVETNAPVAPGTLFRLGSTTKMFTGAAALLLAERGRLKLDAPIGQYAKGLSPRLSQLTLHRLLSNSAGVADFSPPFVSHDDSALSTMVRGWKDDALFGEPGRVYSYSSAGFWLSGYVIEEAGGKPYADMMEELLFKPLRMTRTTFRPHMALTYPLALGHSLSPQGQPEIIRPAFNNVTMWPAGSIFSSTNDLSRFVLALLSGGRLDAQQVLPATMFERMASAHVTMPGEPGVGYGYGLLTFEQRGVRLVMHGGFSRGYGSMIQMSSAQRFAVIVVTNRSGETLSKTTDKAKELFLPLTPAAPAATKKPLPLVAADIARFAGRYVNGPQTWEIIERDGRLVLKNAGEETPLTKTGERRFSYGDTLEGDAAFVPGADGKAEYIFTGLYSARRTP